MAAVVDHCVTVPAPAAATARRGWELCKVLPPATRRSGRATSTPPTVPSARRGHSRSQTHQVWPREARLVGGGGGESAGSAASPAVHPRCSHLHRDSFFRQSVVAGRAVTMSGRLRLPPAQHLLGRRRGHETQKKQAGVCAHRHGPWRRAIPHSPHRAPSPRPPTSRHAQAPLPRFGTRQPASRNTLRGVAIVPPPSHCRVEKEGKKGMWRERSSMSREGRRRQCQGAFDRSE